MFAVTGDDADIASFAVSVDGGEAQAVTPDAQGRFTLDLSGRAGDVTVTLTVTDGSSNTAAAATVSTIAEEPAANDGEETVGGVIYVVYEAENAASTGDPAEVTTAQSDRDQSGGAFVDFVGPVTESVTWTVEVAEDGAYALDILYALGAGKPARPMLLLMDGVQVSTLPFAANSNSAEDQWGPQSATVTLTAGTHTITVTAPGGVGPNVDYLHLSKAPVDVFDPAYVAVDGESRLELEAVDGSTRTLSETEVEFYFTVGAKGVYALDVAANAGAPDRAGLRFLLNGQEIGRDAFPGRGDAGGETVFAALKAGTNYRLTVVSYRRAVHQTRPMLCACCAAWLPVFTGCGGRHGQSAQDQGRLVGGGAAAGGAAREGRAGGGGDGRDRAPRRGAEAGRGGAARRHGAAGAARRGGAHHQRRGALGASRPAEGAPAAAARCKGGGGSRGGDRARARSRRGRGLVLGRGPTCAAGWRPSTPRPPTRRA